MSVAKATFSKGSSPIPTAKAVKAGTSRADCDTSIHSGSTSFAGQVGLDQALRLPLRIKPRGSAGAQVLHPALVVPHQE